MEQPHSLALDRYNSVLYFIQRKLMNRLNRIQLPQLYHLAMVDQQIQGRSQLRRQAEGEESWELLYCLRRFFPLQIYLLWFNFDWVNWKFYEFRTRLRQPRLWLGFLRPLRFVLGSADHLFDFRELSKKDWRFIPFGDWWKCFWQCLGLEAGSVRDEASEKWF